MRERDHLDEDRAVRALEVLGARADASLELLVGAVDELLRERLSLAAGAQADFPGELVFLPPGNSLSAERLAAQAAAPLRVEVLDWSPLGPASATPPPTVVSATPTASADRTATPTASRPTEADRSRRPATGGRCRRRSCRPG